MIRNYTYLLFLLFLGLSQTSVQAQALRGAVLDKNTLQPLPGAELVFYYTSNDRVVAQMGDSEFRIEAPRPGVGWLTVQASGYQSFTILEIQLVAGKERVLEVLLSPMELPEAALTCVDIVESRPFRDRSPIGELPLSREQTLNYPMTYFDPARLAAMAPGVVQTDDGTNSMSIRGNNPSWVRWRLQGLDVVNPNHLPNAGTFSDRPSLSSGGVLMLSAQMIDHSALITGAGSVGYNDGVAGMMDLQLRKGNNQQHEQTIQAGLIGMDISAEGPLSKKKKGASYLFNYRYSTVGILGKLGVSFGGEQITFQDLALHLNFPFRKKDYLSVFVLAGNSENLFTPPDSVAVYKDQFKIDFTSRTGIGGATYYGFVGDEFSYKIGTAFSTQENSRSQVSSAFLQSDLQDQGRFSLHFSGKLRASNRLSWLMGAQSTAYLLRNLSRVEDDLFVSIYSSQLTQQVTQAWLASEFSLLGGRLQATAGINPIGTPLRYSLDPRLQLAWRPASAHQVVFSAAAYSQFDAQWRASINGDLIHARNLGLRYRFQPEVQWEFSAEAFHQQVTNIVVDGLTRDAYSHFNETETLDLSNPVRNGKAFNTGLELMVNRRFADGWFANTNLTLLQSRVSGSDEVLRSSRWEVGQVANLLAGKEWKRKEKKSGIFRHFGVNGRAVFMGGTRALPIDNAASVQSQTTVFIYTNGYTEKNNPYFRVDGRLYWKKSLRRVRNTTFALEFQNLTMHQNIAYRYYDPVTQQVETKYQLGLIPNLSWRMEL